MKKFTKHQIVILIVSILCCYFDFGRSQDLPPQLNTFKFTTQQSSSLTSVIDEISQKYKVSFSYP
jgi:hypothetical protein